MPMHAQRYGLAGTRYAALQQHLRMPLACVGALGWVGSGKHAPLLQASFRQAMAHIGLKGLGQAVQCCKEGLRQSPGSKELVELQALLAELQHGGECRNGPPASAPAAAGASVLDSAIAMLQQAGRAGCQALSCKVWRCCSCAA